MYNCVLPPGVHDFRKMGVEVHETKVPIEAHKNEKVSEEYRNVRGSKAGRMS
jgi:hypothetical protein